MRQGEQKGEMRTGPLLGRSNVGSAKCMKTNDSAVQ